MQTYKPTSAPPVRLTVLGYGLSGAGKTHFGATWPRPIFISDGVEGGYETIGYMDPKAFHDPKVAPEIWANEQGRPGIYSLEDMNKALSQISEKVKKQPGCYKTIVVDSLSFISDLLEDHYRVVFKDEIAKNKWFLFEKLGNSIRHLMIEVHKLPVNVVWLALAREGSEGKSGGPMCAGSMGNKLPAACNMLLYLRAVHKGAGAPASRELRTRPYANFTVRTRYGNRLPDPLPPTYQAIAEAIMMAKRVPVNGAAKPVARPVPRPMVRR